MMRTTRWVAGLGLAAMLGLGCGGASDTTEETTITTPGVPEAATDAPTPAEEGTGETSAADVTLSEDEIAQIEKLPAEDQVLALAQKVCPASDEPLGSMGVPIKVEAGGESIFVCCAGCVEEVKADPDTYIAKLGKK